MKSRWSDKEAADYCARYGERYGEDLALRTYTSRLLGCEKNLVLHGGGNTSVKTTAKNVFGESVSAIYVKASGYDLSEIEPEGHSGLNLDELKNLRKLDSLSDEAMTREVRARLLDPDSATPSIETLVHALIPKKFIDHTHADAILVLTNQPKGERHIPGGKQHIKDALGKGVAILDYVHPGFELAKAVADAYQKNPNCRAMVWMRHGIVTWGETTRESYEAMIELVTRAEEYIARKAAKKVKVTVKIPTPVEKAKERWETVAPVLRGLLAALTDQSEHPYRRVILKTLIDREVLDFVDSGRGRELALSPPLTADHLIRTKALPLWIEKPSYEDVDKFRKQAAKAIEIYRREYNEYVERHAARMPAGVARFDDLPRVILLPGVGAVAAGEDARAAAIVRDITSQTVKAKVRVAAMGTYQGLPESTLFDMEYRSLQHAKLTKDQGLPLAGRVGLVTGAAGAIGSGIAQELLAQGCHLALTDLPGDRLDAMAAELQKMFAGRVIGVPMDVTDRASVAKAFRQVAAEWGGVDLVVVNAGLAHVAPLEEMELEAFHRVARVNVDGTLLVLSEAGRSMKTQATGGDIVLISTKNVFAPGAKFGAYSATKAAAHQLARIASLEMAAYDVRVNMVAPDAVFSHGERKSGLWQQVGPDRMRARGLDEKGLEDYYRNRNLLKAQITARHVANAVLFFAARQTPTTGATIPVDGGLPDATPR